MTLCATACGDGRPGAMTDCVLFGPIRPLDQDIDVMSNFLARQLDTHNETGAANCGWQP